MTKTHLILGFLIVLVLGLAVWVGFFRESAVSELPSLPQPPTPPEVLADEFVYSNASSDMIQVSLPFPRAVVGREFAVIGEARGYWFFEASFPVEVIDQNGAIIARGIASSEGDWMTEAFVPFRADLAIPDDFTGTATVVLRRDNPSGLLENDALISFPITVTY